MDVVPEIERRLGALEKRVDALGGENDENAKLSEEATSGTLASATAANPEAVAAAELARRAEANPANPMTLPNADATHPLTQEEVNLAARQDRAQGRPELTQEEIDEAAAHARATGHTS